MKPQAIRRSGPLEQHVCRYSNPDVHVTIINPPCIVVVSMSPTLCREPWALFESTTTYATPAALASMLKKI